ncbi:hypothetical protein [Desulfonema magnum]|uniref:Uncharacterized protein n=1 Tax=Desulfonema magnum TaxID=45655 RepID=A0A975GLP4_9BACT|nr:hypothetical protein [Desulfonema magnum]QTA85844.1 Uncharacterized protein dnm_018590 [Desulfonema magnum]
MGDEIKIVHSKEEFEKIQRIKAKYPEPDAPDPAEGDVSEQETELTDNDDQIRKEQTMAEKKEAPQEEKPQKAAGETKNDEKNLSEDSKFASALLQHLNATRMTAGQLDLLIQKLELQFDQLVHGNLVGQLKQTDEYTFAKEYLDMEIQPMKDVIERMKKMVAALQNKQLTLSDDLLEAKEEMDNKLLEAKKEVNNEVERRVKTISTKIDDEIQRTKRTIDEQGRGLRNELVDSMKKERKSAEDELKDIRGKFETDTGKLKESLTDLIRQEREKLEKETQKMSKEAFEMKEKVQQSLRTLSEYLVLVIDAAGVHDKIEKLSYDKTLEEMTTINL